MAITSRCVMPLFTSVVLMTVFSCKNRRVVQAGQLNAEQYSRSFATADEIANSLREQNDFKNWLPEEKLPETFFARLDSAEIFSSPLAANSEIPAKSDALGLSELAKSIDLRDYDSPVKNQGSRSTCSAFATVAAMENLARQRSKKVYDISEEHLWSFNAPQGNKGQALVKILTPAAENFIFDEQSWPYSGIRSQTTRGVAKIKAVKLNNWKEVLATLSNNTPVILGIRVTSGWLRPKNGVVSNQAPLLENSPHSNHAVTLVGYRYDSRIDGGGYFIFKNSWSGISPAADYDDDWPAVWGDKGYGYLPFDYGKTPSTANGMWEAYAVTDISIVGESIVPANKPVAPPQEVKPTEKDCGEKCVEEHKVCLTRAMTRTQKIDCDSASSDCKLKCLGVK